jgi:hypothetical protein
LSREGAPEETVKVFACRARSISAERTVMSGPVIGETGERVAIRFEGLGVLQAIISRPTTDGFVAEFQLTDQTRASLAQKIAWLKRKQLRGAVDRREHKRWQPREPRATLVLPGNKIMTCFIIDVSASGVAVSADAAPPLGTPVAVGTVMGRVVRRLEHGFGVQFLEPVDPATIEGLLTRLEAKRRRADGNLVA